jgi:hypothetical protein
MQELIGQIALTHQNLKRQFALSTGGSALVMFLQGWFQVFLLIGLVGVTGVAKDAQPVLEKGYLIGAAMYG